MIWTCKCSEYLFEINKAYAISVKMYFNKCCELNLVTCRIRIGYFNGAADGFRLVVEAIATP